KHFRRAQAEQNRDSHLIHLGRKIATTRGIELPLHECFHQVHYGDIATLDLQSAGSFEAKEPAADNHGFQPWTRSFEQLAGVIKVAKNEDAIFLDVLDRWNQRHTAGGEKQLVVAGDATVVAGDGLCDRVNVNDAHAQPEFDAVLLVPFKAVEHDVIRRLLAGEHGRKQNAVVVDVSFVAKDRDLKLRSMTQYLFDASHARHSISDYH